MRHPLLLTLTILLLATGAFSQPDPNNAGRIQPNVAVKAAAVEAADQADVRPPGLLLLTKLGLYVYETGVLARLNPRSLDELKVIELLPPPPPKPAGPNVTPEKMAQWLREHAQYYYPPNVFVEGEDLLLLIGDQFIRVEGETLEVKYHVAAASEQNLPPDPFAQVIELMVKPELLRDPNGPLLYIFRSRLITVMNVETGQMVAEKPVPGQFIARLTNVLQQNEPVAKNPPPPAAEQNPVVKKLPVASAPPAGQGATTLRAYTVVGTVMKHPDGGQTFWTLKTDNGMEAILIGEQMVPLKKTPNIEGSRVRITGLFTAPTADTPKFASGNLEVLACEVLPAP